MPQARFIVGIGHEKSTTSRSNQLATERTICHGTIVPLVNLVVAHLRRPFFLALPMNGHQMSELMQITGFQRRLTLSAKVFHKMEVINHLLVGLFASIILLF